MMKKDKNFNNFIKILVLFILLIISIFIYFFTEKFVSDNMYIENKFSFTIYHMIYDFIKYPILITILTNFISFIIFSFLNFSISSKKKIYFLIILFIIIIFFILITYFLYFDFFILSNNYYTIYLILEFILFTICGFIISFLML